MHNLPSVLEIESYKHHEKKEIDTTDIRIGLSCQMLPIGRPRIICQWGLLVYKRDVTSLVSVEKQLECTPLDLKMLYGPTVSRECIKGSHMN